MSERNAEMTMPATAGPGPLAGVTVLEVATNASGPFCGQILGDLGAEVIKVERLSGDVTRHAPPFHKGQSGQFWHWNRNKKSIALDLRNPRGREIARALARNADVLLENARPGVMDALGLGYESLVAENPKLVYLSINGYGSSGPYKDQPAYDPVVQGLTGFMYVQGKDGVPAPVRGGVVDKVTSIYGALAVVSALLHVRSGGKGQQLNVNMLDAYSAFVLPEHMGPYTFAESDDATSSVDIFHLLEASDGYLTGLIQLPQLAAACTAFERTDLLSDPRFASAGLVLVNQGELMRELSQATGKLSKAELLELVLEFQLPLAPVNTFEEYFLDAQVQHNQSYLDIEDSELGSTRLINRFAQFSETPARIASLPPRLGQHTDEILAGLDYTPDMIAAAHGEGSVG